MVRSRGASQSQVQVRNKARSKPWSGKNRLFFVGSGRSVWHWRSPQHRSKNGLLSSPGLSFGKPWRSEVEVHLKAKSRCEIRPGASPEATKIVFFLSVPAAAFDIEDHPSTGLRSKSCSGTNRLFFSGSGRNVWHWRSPQHRSKNELLDLARPCCFAVLKAAFWEALTPGHAVSLSRRKRCWEVFPVRSRGASQS